MVHLRTLTAGNGAQSFFFSFFLWHCCQWGAAELLSNHHDDECCSKQHRWRQPLGQVPASAMVVVQICQWTIVDHRCWWLP